jgi:hypothetical protein
MGASTFENIAWAKTAKDAFRIAREEAQFENGNGGYTGSLAEKGNFVMIKVPEKWHGKEQDYGYHLLENDDPLISDKWGPAGCILLQSQDSVEHVPYATSQSKYNQKGARKWVTSFDVYDIDFGSKHFAKSFDSQLEAEKFAKQLTKNINREVIIRITKKLINGEQDIIHLKPKTKAVTQKNSLNEYFFFGWASS